MQPFMPGFGPIGRSMPEHSLYQNHLPQIDRLQGRIFLTVSEHSRVGIATSIERLIDLLDALDLKHGGDVDLEVTGDDEPSLGWAASGQLGAVTPPIWGVDLEADDADGEDSADSWFDEDFEETGDNEPCLGAPERHPENGWGRETKAARREHSQDEWAAGEADEREQECEDEGAQCEGEGEQHDREPSLGWQDEGRQSVLRCGDGDYEADLGTTEEVDQVRRLEIAEGGDVQDGEPSLGWAKSHGKGIVGEQNCTDDREDDIEREKNGDEEDDDAGQYDNDLPQVGGGSVSQYEDGWRPAPGSAVAPVMMEKAQRLPNGDIAREIVDQRDAVRTARLAMRIEQRRRGWNSVGIGNLPQEAFEGMVPEIALLRPTKH